MDLVTATTDRGTGLALPLAKGIGHLMTVYNAMHRRDRFPDAAEWPLTLAEASSEIQEAANHFADLRYDEALVSEDTNRIITAWRERVTRTATELSNAARENPAQSVVEYGDATIRLLVQEAWSILTITDREITGLSQEQTDPGRNP